MVALAGIFLASIAPMQTARADDSNPSTSEIDNYANLTMSASTKQGFFLNNSTFLNSNRGSFTVEMWVNPSESITATNASLFLKQDAVSISLNSLRPEVRLQSGTWATYTSNFYLRTNEWQHLAIVKSAGTLSMYVNGGLIYQTTGVAANVLSQTSILGLGANSWNGSSNQTSPAGDFFAGGIDEVKVWGAARTQSEINDNMDIKISGSATNLLAYWDFNGTGSTSTLYDRTANANNLTIYASPSFPDIKTVSNSGGFSTITFTRSYLNAQGGFNIPTGVSSVSALVVGGGGGGGFDGGGGGGGGGVSQNSNFSVSAGSVVQIEVGGGGAAINGYVGGTFCTGGWTSIIVGCLSNSGNSSTFGNIISSGGGGGGGIESNGGSDSDSGATTRGGGGGGGGQNSKSGATSGGSGAYIGGSSSDVGGNAGGGGASSQSVGGSTTSTLAGNGANGSTATINGFVYGSGGGGGSYNNSTSAAGGTGAGNGGTNAIAATKPLASRGGGGGGGGVGSVAASSGAAGVVIIKFALTGYATLAFTNTPIYRTATTITATTNTSSKVTFLANNKRIASCIKLSTSNLVATCSWKPAVRSAITISVEIFPIDSSYTSSSARATTVITTKRSGNR